jgi:tryptophan 7-halogenase
MKNLEEGKRLSRIVILGGGTAGWMTAASLVHHYRNAPIEITLVESLAIGTIGVGEATIPTLRRFYASLGMTDYDVIAATQASCKLGIRFNGWKQEGGSFIHPFGAFGHDLNGVGFHHFWNRYREAFDLTDIDDYALGAALAKAGKFALPSPTQDAYTQFDWALHFDAGLFATHMREFAKARGVRHIDAMLRDVTLDSTNGHIETLVLDNDQSVAGDLFIDCSGFQALLIGKALGVGYEDYGQWLFCDSAVAQQSERVSVPNVYTDVTARPAGWQWHIPLQHRSGNGHVYSSAHMSDDEAIGILADSLPGKAVTEPRVIRFRPGRRVKAWEKNCIAIGLSSGFLEPLESTSIALIQTGIERIQMLLPVDGFDTRLVDEHNDMARREMERTRDFIILHYKLNQRGDSSFWQQAAAMDLPDTLQRKIDLYTRRGHFVRYRWEMFHPASWLAIYAGFDVWPDSVDPAIAQLTPGEVQSLFMHMRREIDATVKAAPPHRAFLDHCNRLAGGHRVSA